MACLPVGEDLASILDDIRAALAPVQGATGITRLSLLCASSAGGVCAYYVAKRPDIDRLVLLNPQLDYKQRTISSRFYRHDDQLSEKMATRLREDGFIQFAPSLRVHGVSGEVAGPAVR